MNQEFTTQVGSGPMPRQYGQNSKELSPAGVIGMTIGLAIVIAWAIFWLWMLIDLLKRKSMDGSTKLLWVILLIFVNVLGVLLYFFLVYRPSRKAMKSNNGAPISNPVSTNPTQHN